MAIAVVANLSACRECGAPRVTALVPLIVPSADTIDLGNVYVGASARTQVVLRSAGTGALHVASIALVSTDPGLALAPLPALPATLFAGSALNVEIAFTPALAGAAIGELVVKSDADNTDTLRIAVRANGLAPLVCEDGNVCTDDHFDAAAGLCVRVDNSQSCDDASACTSGDVCSAGRCVGAFTPCNDDSICTRDLCDAATGCVYIPDASACHDDNPCTNDLCADDVGCIHETAPDGTLCANLNGCVTASVCVAGVCTGVPVPDGTPCVDGDLCTTGDTCVAGSCAGVRAEVPPTVAGRALGFAAGAGHATFLDDTHALFADGDGPMAFNVTHVDVDDPAQPKPVRLTLPLGQLRRLYPRPGGAVLTTEDGIALINATPGTQALVGAVFPGQLVDAAPAVVVDDILVGCDASAAVAIELANGAEVMRVPMNGCLGVVSAGEGVVALVGFDHVERRAVSATGFGPVLASAAIDGTAHEPCSNGDRVLLPVNPIASVPGRSAMVFLDALTLVETGRVLSAVGAPFVGCAADGTGWVTMGSTNASVRRFDGFNAGSTQVRLFALAGVYRFELRGPRVLLSAFFGSSSPMLLEESDGVADYRVVHFANGGTTTAVARAGVDVVAWSQDSARVIALPTPQTPEVVSGRSFDLRAGVVFVTRSETEGWSLPPADADRVVRHGLVGVGSSGLGIIDARDVAAPLYADQTAFSFVPGARAAVAAAQHTLALAQGFGAEQAILEVYRSPTSWPIPFELVPTSTMDLSGIVPVPMDIRDSAILLNGDSSRPQAVLTAFDRTLGMSRLIDVDLTDPSVPVLTTFASNVAGIVTHGAFVGDHLYLLVATGGDPDVAYAADTLVSRWHFADGTGELRGVVSVSGGNQILVADLQTALVATSSGIAFFDVSTDAPRQLGAPLDVGVEPLAATVAGTALVLASRASITVVSPPCPPP